MMKKQYTQAQHKYAAEEFLVAAKHRSTKGQDAAAAQYTQLAIAHALLALTDIVGEEP